MELHVELLICCSRAVTVFSPSQRAPRNSSQPSILPHASISATACHHVEFNSLSASESIVSAELNVTVPARLSLVRASPIGRSCLIAGEFHLTPLIDLRAGVPHPKYLAKITPSGDCFFRRT
jgi:hypothetical protein